MVERLKKGKWVEWLFLLWLLTLPFGANIAAVSLGPLTLYPNLVFTLLLSLLLPFSFKLWKNFYKIVVAFLLAWLVYALIYGLKLGFSSDVIFDIRSLGMQLLYAITFFSTYSILGQEKFVNSLVLGLRSFLAVLLIFGLFEFITGTHFLSEQFKLLHPENSEFYAPRFVYGNPNDYLLYCNFILIILILLDEHLRKNTFLQLGLVLVLCIFNTSSFSRLSNLVFVFFFGVIFVIMLIDKLKKIDWKYIKYFSISVILVLFLVLKSSVSWGPIFKGKELEREGYVNLKVVVIRNDSIEAATSFLELPYEVKDKIRLFDLNNEEVFTEVNKQAEGVLNYNPNLVRKNLMFNGLDMILENPILGIGPGQFKANHRNKNVKRNTGSYVNAHNFVIEIISEYGLVAWTYFGFLIVLFYKFILSWKHRTIDFNLNFLALYFCLPLFWLMPSSYLYLDINWLLLPLLSILLVPNETTMDGK